MNKLKLNSDKTEILMFSDRHRLSPSLSSIYVCDDVIDLSTKAKNIGVIMVQMLPGNHMHHPFVNLNFLLFEEN